MKSGTYELSAAVLHESTVVDSGHFKAICSTGPGSQRFVEYDDEKAPRELTYLQFSADEEVQKHVSMLLYARTSRGCPAQMEAA